MSKTLLQQAKDMASLLQNKLMAGELNSRQRDLFNQLWSLIVAYDKGNDLDRQAVKACLSELRFTFTPAWHQWAKENAPLFLVPCR